MGQPCAFCDRTKFKERLIYESKNFYVVATLGQITDGGYTLIFPKQHIPCLGAIDGPPLHEELELLTQADCDVTSVEYKSPITIYEHGIVGQTITHAHLHIVPANINATEAIRRDFPLNERGLVGSFAGLARSYQIYPEPYLAWISPNKGLQVCWNPPAEPMYWRIVASKALDRPERANWRTMDAELDRKLWSGTVIRFKPYYL